MDDIDQLIRKGGVPSVPLRQTYLQNLIKSTRMQSSSIERLFEVLNRKTVKRLMLMALLALFAKGVVDTIDNLEQVKFYYDRIQMDRDGIDYMLGRPERQLDTETHTIFKEKWSNNNQAELFFGNTGEIKFYYDNFVNEHGKNKSIDEFITYLRSQYSYYNGDAYSVSYNNISYDVSTPEKSQELADIMLNDKLTALNTMIDEGTITTLNANSSIEEKIQFMLNIEALNQMFSDGEYDQMYMDEGFIQSAISDTENADITWFRELIGDRLFPFLLALGADFLPFVLFFLNRKLKKSRYLGSYISQSGAIIDMSIVNDASIAKELSVEGSHRRKSDEIDKIIGLLTNPQSTLGDEA